MFFSLSDSGLSIRGQKRSTRERGNVYPWPVISGNARRLIPATTADVDYVFSERGFEDARMNWPVAKRGSLPYLDVRGCKAHELNHPLNQQNAHMSSAEKREIWWRVSLYEREPDNIHGYCSRGETRIKSNRQHQCYENTDKQTRTE